MRRSGRTGLVWLVCLAAVPASASAAARDGMTHRVTISAELVNNWTVEGDRDCDPVGAGRLTVKLTTVAATRVRVYRSNDGGRRWNVAVPYGRNLRGMLPARSRAVITRVDNTFPRPPANPEDGPCLPLEKQGCGTSAGRRATAHLSAWDRRRVLAEMGGSFRSSRPCLIGDAELWTGPKRLLGGHREGQFLVRMPRASALKRRVLRVRGRTRQKSAYGDASEGRSTNDITRRVTITFKRL